MQYFRWEDRHWSQASHLFHPLKWLNRNLWPSINPSTPLSLTFNCHFLQSTSLFSTEPLSLGSFPVVIVHPGASSPVTKMTPLHTSKHVLTSTRSVSSFFLSFSLFFKQFYGDMIGILKPQTFNAHNQMGLDLCVRLRHHHHNQGRNTSSTSPSFLCPLLSPPPLSSTPPPLPSFL